MSIKRKEQVYPRLGRLISIISLVFSLFALIISPTFSPAIFFAGLGFLGALMAMVSGNLRVAIFIIYINIATLIVNPFFSPLTNNIEFRILVTILMFLSIVLILILYINFINILVKILLILV